jgi:hypothetical protein
MGDHGLMDTSATGDSAPETPGPVVVPAIGSNAPSADVGGVLPDVGGVHPDVGGVLPEEGGVGPTVAERADDGGSTGEAGGLHQGDAHIA